MVRAVLPIANPAIIQVFRQFVYIDQDLFRPDKRQVFTAVDRVLPAVFEPRVIIIIPFLLRDCRIVLLDPASHLLVETLLQFFLRSQGSFCIGIFGPKIFHGLWIIHVPKPEPGVDSSLAVGRYLFRPFRGDRNLVVHRFSGVASRASYCW